MAYRKTHFVCLVCILTCTPLAQSFNVDELCAKRCLYGRGGVLCNCNAMHFNGKRSGSSQAPTNDLLSYNTQDNYDQYPHEHSRAGPSPNTFIYYGSVNSHDVQPLKKKEYKVDIGVGQELEVKRTKEMTRYTNDALERNVVSLLPDSSLNEGEKENNSESNDDDTRREIASAIKQIITRSTMTSRGQAGLANFNDEFLDDSNDRSGDDEYIADDGSSKYNNGNNNINKNNNMATAAEEPGWRQHLRRLQKVMRQVRQLR